MKSIVAGQIVRLLSIQAIFSDMKKGLALVITDCFIPTVLWNSFRFYLRFVVWLNNCSGKESSIGLLKNKSDTDSPSIKKISCRAISSGADSSYYSRYFLFAFTNIAGIVRSLLTSVMSKFNDRAPPVKTFDFTSTATALIASSLKIVLTLNYGRLM